MKSSDSNEVSPIHWDNISETIQRVEYTRATYRVSGVLWVICADYKFFNMTTNVGTWQMTSMIPNPQLTHKIRICGPYNIPHTVHIFYEFLLRCQNGALFSNICTVDFILKSRLKYIRLKMKIGINETINLLGKN